MKKRKIKLFASIASLALVVAVMGTGIWAATQQAAKVTSTVKFVATGVAASIYLKAASASGELASSNPSIIQSATTGTGDDQIKWTEDASGVTAGYGQLLKTFALNDAEVTSSSLDTTPTAAIAIEFKDANNDGVINKDATFTYTFHITNTTAVQSYYKITLGAQNDAVKAVITTSDLDTSLTGTKTAGNPNGTANTDKMYGALAAATDGTIVVTYTITAPAAPDAMNATQTTKTNYEVVLNKTPSATMTDAEKLEYYNHFNYSKELEGYYSISTAADIASILIEMRTTATYVPEATEQ